MLSTAVRRVPRLSALRRCLAYCANIDASSVVIEINAKHKDKLPLESLEFGKTFSEHMLEIDWDDKNGWHRPRIFPHQNLSLPPGAPALHYGIQCFEGMKAYKDATGAIRLFRPDMNMKRLNNSMTRLAMPAINGNDAFLDLIKKLLQLDASWIPDKEGYSMYIRPTAIGTSPFVGVHASEEVKLFCVLSPVGPYFKEGFKPVRLLADTENVRAWPGGVGNAKVGGNYGPTILPSQLAKKHNCSQVLWLFGEQHRITEVGAMNIFFVLKKKGSNVVELTTAPLTHGDILPGVTRDSILALARGWGNEVEVTERDLTMAELIEAEKDGRLLECFGAGTAAVISPVREIVYKGRDIVIPTGADVGPIANKLWKTLYNIQYGKVDHPWSVKI